MGLPVKNGFTAARREKIAVREADDGNWQLSFADMMTLLQVFFLVILSVSAVELERYAEVAGSMNRAMGSKSLPIYNQMTALEAIEYEVRQNLGDLAHAVLLDERPDAVVISLKGGFFFESGSAELNPRALPFLDILGAILSQFNYRIVVEGHTDNVPIQSDKFPSNWELSAARASAVARRIIDKGQAADRVKVVGLAETQPVAPNEDEEGNPLPINQAKNRRVVILLRPTAYK